MKDPNFNYLFFPHVIEETKALYNHRQKYICLYLILVMISISGFIHILANVIKTRSVYVHEIVIFMLCSCSLLGVFVLESRIFFCDFCDNIKRQSYELRRLEIVDRLKKKDIRLFDTWVFKLSNADVVRHQLFINSDIDHLPPTPFPKIPCLVHIGCYHNHLLLFYKWQSLCATSMRLSLALLWCLVHIFEALPKLHLKIHIYALSFFFRLK